MNHYFQFDACSSISVSVPLDAYIFVGRSREFCIFVFAYGNKDVVLEVFFFFIYNIPERFPYITTHKSNSFFNFCNVFNHNFDLPISPIWTFLLF